MKFKEILKRSNKISFILLFKQVSLLVPTERILQFTVFQLNMDDYFDSLFEEK
jgi:hypothetical protein